MQKITEADDMYLENTEEPVCWQILKKDKRLVSIAWDGGEKQSLTWHKLFLLVYRSGQVRLIVHNVELK